MVTMLPEVNVVFMFLHSYIDHTVYCANVFMNILPTFFCHMEVII
jgi:hypothetical protein